MTAQSLLLRSTRANKSIQRTLNSIRQLKDSREIKINPFMSTRKIQGPSHLNLTKEKMEFVRRRFLRNKASIDVDTFGRLTILAVSYFSSLPISDVSDLHLSQG